MKYSFENNYLNQNNNNPKLEFNILVKEFGWSNSIIFF